MRFRGVLLTVVVVLGGLLTLFNWPVLAAPVPVNLLVTRADLPLGLTLLVVVVAVAALFFLGGLLDRAGQLRQLTQVERQLDDARARLDACREAEREAEVGRLEQRLAEGLTALGARLDAGLVSPPAGPPAPPEEDGTAARLDALEARLVAHLESVEERVRVVRDELAADIAQAEDALIRLLDGRPTEEG